MMLDYVHIGSHDAGRTRAGGRAVSPERSQPSGNKWFFLYTVTIVNEGSETVQLLTRHWTATDSAGHTDEVRGPGVVGKQPTLAPGE